MNGYEAKKRRKEYRRIAHKIAKGRAGSEIFRLARKRDILGIILILENLALAILFFIYILPRI
jgi:hypothetical protein